MARDRASGASDSRSGPSEGGQGARERASGTGGRRQDKKPAAPRGPRPSTIALAAVFAAKLQAGRRADNDDDRYGDDNYDNVDGADGDDGDGLTSRGSNESGVSANGSPRSRPVSQQRDRLDSTGTDDSSAAPDRRRQKRAAPPIGMRPGSAELAGKLVQAMARNGDDGAGDRRAANDDSASPMHTANLR